MQIAISAVIATIISLIILNCGESIEEWVGDKFEDAKEWLRRRKKL